MKQINSRQNPEIQAVAKLSSSKERYAQNRFIAEGARTIATLLASHIKLIQLYATQKMVAHAQTLTRDAMITIVADEVMDKISQSSTASGLLGVFALPEKPNAALLKPGLVLARISDPGNMGTLIRTSAALNIPSLVVIEGTDPWSPKVVQASAGTIGSMHIFQWSWRELVNNKNDYKLCALVVKDGKPPHDLDTKKSILVVGSEAEGIPDAWLSDCEQRLTLPMPGNTESLNAAIAGSIALYLTRS